MSFAYNSLVSHQTVSKGLLSFVKTDDCIIHPRRRRLRHMNGINLRNLSIDGLLSRTRSSPTTPTSSPTTLRGNTKETIQGFDTPSDRQLHLQSLNNEKFINVFFSMHFNNKSRHGECFYVSEVINRSLNANFQEFSLASMINSRDQSFILKIWVSNQNDSQDWKLLSHYKIELSSLLYLNKSLDEIQIDYKNAVLISLYDGVYILPTNGFNLDEYLYAISDDSGTPRMSVPSLTFDLIMKLNNLDTVIEDLRRSKKRIALNIEQALSEYEAIDTYKIDKIRRSIKKTKSELSEKRERLNKLKRLKDQKLKAIQCTKQNQSQKQHYLLKIKESFSASLIQNEMIQQDLTLERNKITRNLLEIFPCQDIQHWLDLKEFEILPLELNLATLFDLINASDKNVIQEINAGFGYISQIVFLLSRYLAIPLRYQVQPFGSTSYIIDRTSQINQRNIFPLFYTNHFYRFQYAVILLNRNIQDIITEGVYHY